MDDMLDAEECWRRYLDFDNVLGLPGDDADSSNDVLRVLDEVLYGVVLYSWESKSLERFVFNQKLT